MQLSDQGHATLRHYGTLAFLYGVAVLAFFAFLHHIAPPDKPATVIGKGSVSVVSSPKPIEVDAQSAVAADQAWAALSAKDHAYTNLLNSYESLLVQGMQPRYVPKLTVQAKLVAASPSPLPSAPPGWTKQQTQARYDTDRAAVASVFNDPNTKLNLNATLTQVEAPQARCGTLLASSGSGVACDIVRRGQYNVELGGLVHASHISPALGIGYAIPHTSLSPEITFSFDKRLTLGIGATVRITH